VRTAVLGDPATEPQPNGPNTLSSATITPISDAIHATVRATTNRSFRTLASGQIFKGMRLGIGIGKSARNRAVDPDQRINRSVKGKAPAWVTLRFVEPVPASGRRFAAGWARCRGICRGKNGLIQLNSTRIVMAVIEREHMDML
jgi:hypothetical protein